MNTQSRPSAFNELCHNIRWLIYSKLENIHDRANFNSVLPPHERLPPTQLDDISETLGNKLVLALQSPIVKGNYSVVEIEVPPNKRFVIQQKCYGDNNEADILSEVITFKNENSRAITHHIIYNLNRR
jgi:hypothetical protein